MVFLLVGLIRNAALRIVLHVRLIRRAALELCYTWLIRRAALRIVLLAYSKLCYTYGLIRRAALRIVLHVIGLNCVTRTGNSQGCPANCVTRTAYSQGCPANCVTRTLTQG